MLWAATTKRTTTVTPKLERSDSPWTAGHDAESAITASKRLVHLAESFMETEHVDNFATDAEYHAVLRYLDQKEKTDKACRQRPNRRQNLSAGSTLRSFQGARIPFHMDRHTSPNFDTLQQSGG